MARRTKVRVGGGGEDGDLGAGGKRDGRGVRRVFAGKRAARATDEEGNRSGVGRGSGYKCFAFRRC